MNRRNSTSLFGNTSDIPAWVTPLQKNVYLSAFFNDLPQGLDVFTANPSSGFTGKMYYNEPERKLYIYSDYRWNDVARQANLSDHVTSQSVYLSASHAAPGYTTLTKNHSATVTSANIIVLEAGKTLHVDATIMLRPTVLTDPTLSKSCNFVCNVSRKSDGTSAIVSDPVVLLHKDLAFQVTCDASGWVRIQVDATEASGGVPYKSGANCVLSYL